MIRRLLTRNLLWKLISLAAAIFVWRYFASESDVATIVAIPVQYKNYPMDLEISSAIQDSISVEARGSAGQLRDLSTAHLATVLDFGSVKAPGERTFTLTAREVALPRGVQLVRTIPGQLRFMFERRATRALKVDVPYSGALPAGMRIDHIEVLPPALEIAGPESRVNAAKNAVSDPLDLSRITGDAQQHLAVFVADPEVRFVTAPQVTVKVYTEKTQ